MKRAKESVVAPLADHRRTAELEAWICERLHLRDLFAGYTDAAMRADRLKAVLLERGLTESVAGSRGGKPVKWRDLFFQLYAQQID